MAIITLSRQLGCSGSQVAEDIAEQLGYQTVGKKEITDMIVKYTDQYSQELKSQKKLERAEEEVQAGLFERLRHDHSSYVNLLTSLIYDIAGQDTGVDYQTVGKVTGLDFDSGKAMLILDNFITSDVGSVIGVNK